MAETVETHSLPVAEATINPLPKLGIHLPVQKDLRKKLNSFNLFSELPQELQDEIWTLAVQTPTVLAPQRVTENGLVDWNKQAKWSFQGMDPHTISQVCKNARYIVKKHCVAFRGKNNTPITTKTPVIYANVDTTMFVIGDVISEGDSFYENDIAKMKYITIEGRNPGFCWVPDPYNLFPGPASGALGILATLAVDLKAVFVQNKLTISASEDPERVAQDLEMYQTPDSVSFTDGIRPLNANLFAYLSRFVSYNGPEINDERRCTFVQHRERKLCRTLFVAENAFRDGSPRIHFLPLYSPYREYYADASEDRDVDHAACHHELTPRDAVTDDQSEKICRPPPAMTETQALLTARQTEMEDYEEAMLAAWPEEWL
ncbi:unnamed protein product [Clonostachys solani]|uniref:2EXR domain-containing protein n=1 Tax=Clonostachys solani TaxID=160281 RepID=A0A9N9Z7B4_9HYPO|nr:unnamed protein product [Clonostachys solani]